jgi:SAM-dependent methyltransferase
MPDDHPTPLAADASAQRWEHYGLAAIADHGAIAYLAQRWAWEAPLYAEIERSSGPRGRILEVGAGTGANALWLAARGHDVTGVEYRPPLVEAARGLAEQLGVPARFEVGDAFDLSAYRGFDVTFSAGMIEHWDRADTVRALREQAATARAVVATVPTPHTHHTGEITDEHFYSPGEWRSIFADAGLRGVRTFGYGIVPSRTGRVTHLVLPHGLLRAIQRYSGRLSMSLGIAGTSATARQRVAAA